MTARKVKETVTLKDGTVLDDEAVDRIVAEVRRRCSLVAGPRPFAVRDALADGPCGCAASCGLPRVAGSAGRG
jgi:hypothetical protein